MSSARTRDGMGIQDWTGLTRLAEAAAWRALDDLDPANPGAWNDVSLVSTWRGEKLTLHPGDGSSTPDLTHET
ncbi:hypothetical protein E5D57_007273 [Metarhizium anisopliae]|nr:hypothetical protein E5D57_007273 [Metarhizium anisopliae]